MARLSSAKAATAVRIRSTPLLNLQVILGGFFIINFYKKLIKEIQQFSRNLGTIHTYFKPSTLLRGFFIINFYKKLIKETQRFSRNLGTIHTYFKPSSLLRGFLLKNKYLHHLQPDIALLTIQ